MILKKEEVKTNYRKCIDINQQLFRFLVFQCVYVSSGKKFKYKKLCICTGAVPKVIAEDSPYVVWIRDTESVCQFQARMKGARRILIVGNGGIATEMVYEVTGEWVVCFVWFSVNCSVKIPVSRALNSLSNTQIMWPLCRWGMCFHFCLWLCVDSFCFTFCSLWLYLFPCWFYILFSQLLS